MLHSTPYFEFVRQWCVEATATVPQTMSTIATKMIVLNSLAGIMYDDDDLLAVHMTEQNNIASLHRVRSLLPYRRGSMFGRRFCVHRNDPRWFFKYALVQEYVTVGSWRARFRITLPLYLRLVTELRAQLQRKDTQLRCACSVEVKVAALLMWTGGDTYEAVASTLGVGPSTVGCIVKEVSRAICATYSTEIHLPRAWDELQKVMNGFQSIAGLPYCVGAVDGSHIKWTACPTAQFYAYRCYKGFTSVVLFGVADSRRKFIYVDVCLPGVLSDSTLWQMSRLRSLITSGEWLGADIPSLTIGDVDIRPYLIGDCAFRLTRHMMTTTSSTQQAAQPPLARWEVVASMTRKPIECAFGILKNRFACLKLGIRMHHEDDIAYAITACVTLHNLCISVGDDGVDFATVDDVDLHTFASTETCPGKKTREALLQYISMNTQ